MQKLTKVTLIALATFGIGGAAKATISNETASAAHQPKVSEGTGLLPTDLMVDAVGMTQKSVKPLNFPKRVGCDTSCSSNRC